ncbi:MAG: hypothetical protein U0X20_07945 [Caldilineaceae bacterium]
MPQLTNLEFWNVLVIAAAILAIKLCEVARNRENERQNISDFRKGFIIGMYYDAQIAILTAVVAFAWLLSDSIGLLGAGVFVVLCLAVLSYAPRVTRAVAMAFSVPHVRKPRRRVRYHAAGTYNSAAVRTIAIRNKKP